jgi:hypothetical protein
MKTLVTALLLIITTASFSQAKKVAVLTTSMSTDDELNYDVYIRPYVDSRLKNIPGVTVSDFSSPVSNTVKIKRNVVTGTFYDNTLLKNVAANGSTVLALVYYNISIIEKKVLDPGMESTSYGCEMELYVQLVNTSSAQIINSKKFYFSMGMKYKNGENYKTKEEAVKATLASPAFGDDKKSIPVDLSAYLAESLK